MVARVQFLECFGALDDDARGGVGVVGKVYGQRRPFLGNDVGYAFRNLERFLGNVEILDPAPAAAEEQWNEE